jgi:hypothetical protein
MGESLTQPRRVQEDTPQGRKLLLYEKNTPPGGA